MHKTKLFERLAAPVRKRALDRLIKNLESLSIPELIVHFIPEADILTLLKNPKTHKIGLMKAFHSSNLEMIRAAIHSTGLAQIANIFLNSKEEFQFLNNIETIALASPEDAAFLGRELSSLENLDLRKFLNKSGVITSLISSERVAELYAGFSLPGYKEEFFLHMLLVSFLKNIAVGGLSKCL